MNQSFASDASAAVAANYQMTQSAVDALRCAGIGLTPVPPSCWQIWAGWRV